MHLTPYLSPPLDPPDEAIDDQTERERLAERLIDGVCPWHALQEAHDKALMALSALPVSTGAELELAAFLARHFLEHWLDRAAELRDASQPVRDDDEALATYWPPVSSGRR